MTDRRASLEGVTSRSRHRSPTSEALPAHHESLATSSGAPSSGPASRRRLVRPKANSHDTLPPAPSTWVDTAKGESRKAKRGSGSPATEPRAEPLVDTASISSSSEESEQEGEADTVESLPPNPSRASEKKTGRTLRRRGGSTISSTTDQPHAFRRRRPTEDGILGRRSTRPNHGSSSSSSQKRAETLGKLPNPSLISILSELTQQSSASSGSNTTITQKSYDNKSYISKQKAAKGKKREQQTKSTPVQAKNVTMESPQSNVFQFLNEGLSSEQFVNGVPNNGRPMTSSSTSSSATSHDTESDEDDDSSSDTEETVADTPMTSPTSTRRLGSERPRYREGIGINVGVPVHQNGAGPRPVRSDQSEHFEVEDAESDDGEDGEQSEEETDEDDDGDGSAYAADHGHAHHLALERAPPPRIPSAASSQRSDPHARRLRRQEQELANHILQSPQPHREFQFIGGPSPHPYPAIPMYDPYAHSGSPPGQAQQQALGWPPPPVPPPPPIGYNSPPHAPPAPYSPDNSNRFAMAPHSPVAAPNMAVRVSPYHHTGVHPPQYQAQPPGTDLSRSTVVGYELLADKLSGPVKHGSKASTTDQVVPMYRKFETLNHRVLLHLQDEICELEEELRSLDECIVQSSPRDEVGRLHPASRRGDARYGGELHYRRTELLGRIYLKLGQYNQALSSFSNLVKTLEPAGTEDIQAYRAWMEKRAPIDYAESRFLDRKDDLLTVSQRRGSSVGGAGPHQSAAVALPLILVLPLMAFAIVPGLLGRLFMIVIIGGAEVRLVTTTPELMNFMAVDEWIKCGSV